MNRAAPIGGAGFQPNRHPDGTFATGPVRAEAGIELTDPGQAGDGRPHPAFGQDAPPLSAPEARLAAVMQRLHEISPTRYSDAPWIADETFTCDGGAVAAALVAREIGIPAQLHVGLYWHTDVQLRADLMGEDRGEDESDEDWDENLRHIESDFMDEHHHWVTLHPGQPDELRVDPNGPVRGEPHLTRTQQPGSYQDCAEYLVYDPRDDLDEIADTLYPGLLEHVRRALR